MSSVVQQPVLVPPRPRTAGPPSGFVGRHPVLCLFLIIFASNAAGSYFNISYNDELIVQRWLDEAQRAAFWEVAFPAYNALVYPVCVAIAVALLWPLGRGLRDLRAGIEVPQARLHACRVRLLNLPLYTVCLGLLGWLPGAVFFPLVICAVGGSQGAAAVWTQFAVSFVVSALLTTAQTFILVERYLVAVLYPAFFKDVRPAEVPGAVQVGFRVRLLLLWAAVAVMPLAALLAVAVNIRPTANGLDELHLLAIGVAVVGTASGSLILYVVGRDVQGWITQHEIATERISQGDYDIYLPDQRPDEWGRLTDCFNDMTAALRRARRLRERFGEAVNPEVREAMMEEYTDVGGHVKDITVLFADIRGFTRRSAGQPPERVVELLNAFLTLSVAAVEGNGGVVEKFLGDGFLALFGALRGRGNHAELALVAARDLLERLETLNAVLARRGEAPLQVGIGIHSGPALVGCIGATIPVAGGRARKRHGFTAIGETVNLGQRLEQLTKRCGGPVLLSEETVRRLPSREGLVGVGPVTVEGFAGALVVYRAGVG
jgi:adenylate cyclase